MDENDKDWQRRTDVETIADYCIPKWHPLVGGATFYALGRPKASKNKGRDVWATLRKATPAERAIAESSHETPPDYVIVVALDVWARLPRETRIALIDHELCHAAGQDEHGGWTIVGHDIEEFGAVVARHGAWRDDIRRFIEIAQRVELPQLTFDDALKTEGAMAEGGARV